MRGNRRGKKIRLPDEQKLLNRILQNYDTAARPVYNASHTVTVKFGLTLTQIADMVCSSVVYPLLYLIRLPDHIRSLVLYKFRLSILNF